MSPHNKPMETWEIPLKKVWRQYSFLPKRFLGLEKRWKLPFLSFGTSVLYCFCSLHVCSVGEMVCFYMALLPMHFIAMFCYFREFLLKEYSTQIPKINWSTLLLAEDSKTIFHGIWFPFLLRVSFGFFISLPFSPLHLNLHLAKVQLLLLT